MTVEIDDAVPMPTKQAWTKPEPPANVGNEGSGYKFGDLQGHQDALKQVDLEEAIADTYQSLLHKSLTAAKWFNAKNFLVWFVPTQEGISRYGWQSHLVVPQLVSEFDAARIRHRCGFKDVGADFAKFATIELQLVLEQELMSGGFNYQFDANQYEPSQSGGAHPAGNFEAYVSACSVEPNKAGNGGNFVVEFTTQGGSIKKYYSLWHENPKTVESAHKQLSALSHATGIYRINLQDGGRALLNGRCRIEVGKQADNDYMEIKKVFDQNGNLPGKGSNNQQQNGPAGGFGQQQPQQGGQQPQQQGGGFGGQQPQQPQQQPQQGGGFGGGFGGGAQQPQGGFGAQQGPGPGFAGGGQPQQPQQDYGQPQGGWGGSQQQPQQPQGGGQGWGQQPQQGGQQPQQGGGWQQDQGNSGGGDKPGWAS